MRFQLIAFITASVFASSVNFVYGTEQWSSADWSVYARDAQDDEDDCSCSLSSKYGVSFRMVASDDKKEMHLELGNDPHNKTKPLKETYDIGWAFDNGDWGTFSANYIQEFDNITIDVSNRLGFLEQFAHSKVLGFIGEGITRNIALHGSRAAVEQFRKCLAQCTQPATVTTTPAGARPSMVPYGSKEGQEVSVVSISGLNTARAEIQVRYTRENAKAFCVGYILDKSDACIERERSDFCVSSKLQIV